MGIKRHKFIVLFNVRSSTDYIANWYLEAQKVPECARQPLASVRRPCTLISIWTFVSRVRGLLSPASLNMRARATLRGVVLLLLISTYKNVLAFVDRAPSPDEWLKGHRHDWGQCLFTKIIWHEILIDFSQEVIQNCTNHFGKDWAINRAEITH